MMDNDFLLLAKFLENVEPEVSARSGQPVTDEQRALIERFATGELGASERERILPDLLENEKALRELVQVIRAQNS